MDEANQKQMRGQVERLQEQGHEDAAKTLQGLLDKGESFQVFDEVLTCPVCGVSATAFSFIDEVLLGSNTPGADAAFIRTERQATVDLIWAEHKGACGRPS